MESIDLLDISFSNRIFEIKELNLWFAKHWDNYIEISERWKCSRCPEDLPCICSNPDWEWKFLRLYKALDELLRLHRLEEYCQKELEEFGRAQFDENKLKIWIHKNEKVGVQELSIFEITYLDHQNNGKYLRVYGNDILELQVINTIREKMNRAYKTELDFEVFVDVRDFQYIIKYLAVFNRVYWKEYPLNK